MKTALKHLAIVFALALVTVPSYGWSRRVHSAIAYIAESHMTPKAKKAVNEILDGKSIVYYAAWLDDYRKVMKVEQRDSQGNFKKMGEIPHVFKVGKDGKVALTYNRDAVSVINKSIENLQNYKELDDSTRLASLQCIIHLVGDIHCPAHVRYADADGKSVDKKYDGTKVIYGKKKVGMHRVWDVMVIDETTAGGVYDLAYIADRVTKNEIKEIQKGTPEAWGQESAAAAKSVWYVKDGEEITKKYFLDNRELAISQIQKAGLRLAKVLNDLFK